MIGQALYTKLIYLECQKNGEAWLMAFRLIFCDCLIPDLAVGRATATDTSASLLSIKIHFRSTVLNKHMLESFH